MWRLVIKLQIIIEDNEDHFTWNYFNLSNFLLKKSDSSNSSVVWLLISTRAALLVPLSLLEGG